MKRPLRIVLVLLVLLAASGVVSYVLMQRPRAIRLTGIVDTDEVIASSQISGRLQQVFVREGDSVTNGELLAEIQPQQWQADLAFYEKTESQTVAQLAQAKADLENARLNFGRIARLYSNQVESVESYDQARTTYEGAQAHVESADRLVQATRAQVEKAKVQLGYTTIRAPISGIVDKRVALTGEVVNPGQAIVTLINPDALWVRADVEESYIDRIHLGQKLLVTLPSGATREGTVYYRSVDADYATQRDVSRTKRDIRTFQIRLRCDNRDRSLAVGMTAYVSLPLAQH
ncbi:MAG TPA: efflux RND transporter periplasmic adaptor subunit [Verrucomicrobiae bacterium]|nr:efflux RND transporter periplasmic adaptor subunit [Verrucomicrobiae bacterium]